MSKKSEIKYVKMVVKTIKEIRERVRFPEKNPEVITEVCLKNGVPEKNIRRIAGWLKMK